MKKILVIDDEQMIVNVISDILTNAGYDVVTANDGEEGLKRFEESDFDLVITDFNMPIYDGNETAKRIRDKKKIPIVGITSTPADFDHRNLDIILEKPFSIEELTKCVNKLIQAHKQV